MNEREKPLYLYKYMPFLEPGNPDRIKWIKEILTENKIYIPPASKLNDPFEAIIPINNDDIDITEKLTQIINLKKKQQNTGILSFASEWDNILMWSHYGDGHAGICIEFKVNDERLVRSVIYKNNMNFNDDDYLLTKSTHWSYEKEFRIIDESNKHVFLRDIGISVTAIIIGANFHDHSKFIKEILPEAEVTMYQSRPDLSSFNLLKFKINNSFFIKHCAAALISKKYQDDT